MPNLTMSGSTKVVLRSLLHCRLLISVIAFFAIANSVNAQVPPIDISVGKNGAKWINLVDSTAAIADISDYSVDNSGNIYVIGMNGNLNYNEHFIAKVRADGRLDTGFYEKGFREIGFGTVLFTPNLSDPYHHPDFVRVNASQSKVWIINGSLSRFRTVRILPNGYNDSAYGRNGYRNDDYRLQRNFKIRDVIMTKDDGFILVGIDNTLSGADSLYCLKFTAQGDIDSSYNGGNVIAAPFNFNLRYQHSSLKTDGSLYVTVSTGESSKDSIGVVSITADGQLDRTFGQDGLIRLSIGDNDLPSIKTTILPDGSLSVLSVAYTLYIEQYKLTSAGVIDLSFGTNGKRIYERQEVYKPQFLYNRGNDPYDLTTWAHRSTFSGGGGPDTVRYVRLTLRPDGYLEPPGKQIIYRIGTTGGWAQTGDAFNTQCVNGKLYLAGYTTGRKAGYTFSLTRLAENMQLDSAYGINGKAKISFNQSRDAITDIQPLSGGGFIIKGSYDNRVAIMRLSNTGELDYSFGTSGFVFPGDSLSVNGIRIDNYDRIWLFGFIRLEKYKDSKFVVQRLLQNGQMDSTFGGNGIIAFYDNLPEPFLAKKDQWVQYDNKMLILYEANASGDRLTDAAIMRLNEDGSIDRSFGNNGRVLFDFYKDFINPNAFFDYDDIAKKILVLKDSSIIVAGTYDREYHNVIVKLLKDGSIVRNAGVNGLLDFSGSASDDIRFMGQLDTSRLVIAYQMSTTSVPRLEVMNCTLDLKRTDSSYGGYFSSRYFNIERAVLTRGGNLIATGIETDSNNISSLFTIALKPGPIIDTNRIHFVKTGYQELLPDTSTLTDPKMSDFGSSLKYAANVIDSEGQLAIVTTAQKNYLQDIFFTRRLINDRGPASKPVAPSIGASPGLVICSDKSITLLAHSPGCDGCAYEWSDGQKGKSISVNQAGAYIVTVKNAAGMAKALATVSTGSLTGFSIIDSPSTFCPGTEFTLTATGATSYTWDGPGLVSTTGAVVKAKPLTDAIYIVTGTQNGCTAKDTISVKAGNKLKASLDVSISGCPSDTITLRATATNAGTDPVYSWYRNNLYAGTGEEIVFNNVNNNDAINCVLVPENICTDPDTAKMLTIINCIRESVQLLEGLSYFTLSPNPAKNVLHIGFGLTKDLTLSFEITDNAGRPVYKFTRMYKQGSHLQTVLIQNLQSGIYFVTVSSGSKRFTRSIIVVN